MSQTDEIQRKKRRKLLKWWNGGFDSGGRTERSDWANWSSKANVCGCLDRGWSQLPKACVMSSGHSLYASRVCLPKKGKWEETEHRSLLPENLDKILVRKWDGGINSKEIIVSPLSEPFKPRVENTLENPLRLQPCILRID